MEKEKDKTQNLETARITVGEFGKLRIFPESKQLMENSLANEDKSSWKHVTALTGYLPKLYVGAEITVKGFKEKSDSTLLFHIVEIVPEEEVPLTVLTTFLQSNLCKGMGAKHTEQIIAKFGKKAIKIIEEEPHRLQEVEGLGKARSNLITDSWLENKDILGVMIFLAKHYIHPEFAFPIYKAYGKFSIERLNTNPYKLASEVEGIGFDDADKIAYNLGIEKSDQRRLMAGVVDALQKNSLNGHTFAMQILLPKEVSKLLEIEIGKVIEILRIMKEQGHSQVVFEGERIYLKTLHSAEVKISDFIKERSITASFMDSNESLGDQKFEQTVFNAVSKSSINNGEINNPNTKIPFDRLGNSCEIIWSDDQIKAIDMAMKTRLLVITGGPGTGKTTVARGIVSQMLAENMKVLLCAPTSPTAKRLSEATGQPVFTIERFLESKQGVDANNNKENIISGDCLIVDEVSMLDVLQMAKLCDAIPENMKVILLGDPNQMESIGPGNVLEDILKGKYVAKVKLTDSFRYDKDNEIPRGANQILSGDFSPIHTGYSEKGHNLYFLEEHSGVGTADLVVELMTKIIPESFGYNIDDIQILVPVTKGLGGTLVFNSEIQTVINSKTLGARKRNFYPGDRVVQISDNELKQVFASQIGKLVDIDETRGKYFIKFENGIVEYSKSEMRDIRLAYALTIHGSQGSEYPVVIVPVLYKYQGMLRNSLLYSAVSKGKSLVFIVGQRRAVLKCLRDKKRRVRMTSLSEKINV